MICSEICCVLESTVVWETLSSSDGLWVMDLNNWEKDSIVGELGRRNDDKKKKVLTDV